MRRGGGAFQVGVVGFRMLEGVDGGGVGRQVGSFLFTIWAFWVTCTTSSGCHVGIGASLKLFTDLKIKKENIKITADSQEFQFASMSDR